METTTITHLLQDTSLSKEMKTIADKVLHNERINAAEGLLLYESGELGFLGALSNFVREKKNGNYVYFNRNFHIEPTNICVYNCKFCSYRRRKDEAGSWDNSIEEILAKVQQYKHLAVTEVHIVGGVHPNRDVYYYGELIQEIKKIIPEIHVKAFTAVELEFMIRKAHISLKEGLLVLKNYGLDSIPGGGAEIFNEEIRKQVCHEKSSSNMWLEIHELVHQLGIPSNATMLYGHLENYEHRIDHLLKLRNLQDRTKGFNTFIPLKFRKANNNLAHIGEVNTYEDLKNYAVSRIFLDNFDHLKAYWPMIGKKVTQLSLSFGVDDIDGTIDDSTKIYSMAGAEDNKPAMKTVELTKLVKNTGRVAVERDTLYRIIKKYDEQSE